MQLSQDLLLDVESYGESDGESDGEGQSEAARKGAYKYKPELLWLKYGKASVAVL